MQKFVEAVHFNEDHPENHNIVLTNLQSKHMMIYDGDQFMKVMKDKTIDQLITDKKNTILSNIQKFDLSEEQEKNLKSKMKRPIWPRSVGSFEREMWTDLLQR